MGNLGWYQWMTAAAKKAGGPKALFGIVMGAGYLVFRVVEIGGKKVFKLIKKEDDDTSIKDNLETYQFTTAGEGDQGLKFSSGDLFHVLGRHGNAVLIEKRNDKNNPYFVDSDWLIEVSSFSANK